MTASDPGSRPLPGGRLYVIATVHLDTQWRWTVQDTIRDFIPATLERNFDLLERYPFFIVSFEGAFRYQLMKEYYPEQFDVLRGWVESGRWRPAGSMLDSPDVNIVAPESLLRHILYGNGFFERELGTRSGDLFLPDCFGFGWATPSIAAHCGLRGFSGQKFGRWMAPAKIPFDVGVWQGPDGGEVVAAIRPEGYGEGLAEDLSQAPRFPPRLAATGRASGAYVGVKYVGVGDRGGGLDEESMRWLQRSVEGEGPVEVVVGGSDRLYGELSAGQVARLPRHRGELLLPTHGTGCLTSQAQLKRWNRRNESLGDAAERAALLADSLGLQRYPAERLREAWSRFLWHQMHDDLTGTSIPAAYEFTDNDLLLSLHQFAAILTQSVGAVSGRMDTRGDGQPVVVFNPLSCERQDVVSVTLPPTVPQTMPVRVIGPDGSEVPCQRVGDGQGTDASLLFLARLPPVGVGVFDLQWGEEPSSAASDLEVGPSSMANHRYRIDLDDRGDVRRVFDRRSRRELLAEPIRWQLIRDRSSRWPAWEILYRDLEEAEPENLRGPARVRVLESGPVRVALEVLRKGRRSTFRQVMRLAGGEAGERFEVDCQVDWRTRGRMLKACFRPQLTNPSALYDLGLGFIERGNNRREKYEVPAQQWAAVAAARGAGGLSILNDCKYGWDKPDDRTLRLTLLRSPRVIRKFRHQGRQDFGPHRFAYALYGHLDDWQAADSSGQAARLNQPLCAFLAPPHPGDLGREHSLLRLSTRQVTVQALKRAERQEAWVLRLRELSGRPAGDVTVETTPRLEGGAEINGMEDETGPATVENGRLGFDLPPFGLKSFVLRPSDDGRFEAPDGGQTVVLPFDVTATRPQGRADRRGFDGRGNSIPAELWPESLEIADVVFRLGNDGENALSCRGQRLSLPRSGHDSVQLLMAATRGSITSTLTVGQRPQTVSVPGFSGSLFRRPKARQALRPPATVAGQAQLAEPEVAWVGTHLHDGAGNDRPYVFCYLFKVTLELPDAAAELRLPEAPELHLFAATLATAVRATVVPAGALYD